MKSQAKTTITQSSRVFSVRLFFIYGHFVEMKSNILMKAKSVTYVSVYLQPDKITFEWNLFGNFWPTIMFKMLKLSFD